MATNPIQFVIGDATAPGGTGPRIIVHVCNDTGGWGRGFVLALSRRWREPEIAYRKWHRDKEKALFALGQVQFVPVAPDLWVANLIGQRGIRRAGGSPPVDYAAIREGLSRVALFAKAHNATIHMPRIGTGLAGGDWAEIEPLIAGELIAAGVPVTVYDLPQTS